MGVLETLQACEGGGADRFEASRAVPEGPGRHGRSGTSGCHRYIPLKISLGESKRPWIGVALEPSRGLEQTLDSGQGRFLALTRSRSSRNPPLALERTQAWKPS